MPYYNYRRYPFYNKDNNDFRNSEKDEHSNYVDSEDDSSNNDANNSNRFDNKLDSSPTFNFLGFNFHFDDLLLIALIYFLYTEDVHDPELFIALIMLLLS